MRATSLAGIMQQAQQKLPKREGATRPPGGRSHADSKSKTARSNRKSYRSSSNSSNGNSSYREGRGSRSSRDISSSSSSGSSDISSSLSEKQKADLLRAFDLFDEDGDGKLSSRELMAACRALGVNDINKDKLRAILLLEEDEEKAKEKDEGNAGKKKNEEKQEKEERIGEGRRKHLESDAGDTTCDFFVSFEQFMRLCLPCRASTAEQKTEEIFALLDTDAKGYVTAADLLNAAHAVKSYLSLADMELMIREAATDGRLGMTYKDFQVVYKRMQSQEGARSPSTMAAVAGSRMAAAPAASAAAVPRTSLSAAALSPSTAAVSAAAGNVSAARNTFAATSAASLRTGNFVVSDFAGSPSTISSASAPALPAGLSLVSATNTASAIKGRRQHRRGSRKEKEHFSLVQRKE